jgi:hypothetical protein
MTPEKQKGGDYRPLTHPSAALGPVVVKEVTVVVTVVVKRPEISPLKPGIGWWS